MYFNPEDEVDDFEYRLSKDLERIYKEKGITYIKLDFDNKDDYYKDYKILPYKDIIIFKGSDTPLVWDIPFTFEKDNAAHYHYGREAMHGILYAVANSKAMNGLMPGSTFTTPKTMAEKILIGIDVVGVVLILALGWFIYRGFRKWKRSAAEPA